MALRRHQISSSAASFSVGAAQTFSRIWSSEIFIKPKSNIVKVKVLSIRVYVTLLVWDLMKEEKEQVIANTAECSNITDEKVLIVYHFDWQCSMSTALQINGTVQTLLISRVSFVFFSQYLLWLFILVSFRLKRGSFHLLEVLGETIIIFDFLQARSVNGYTNYTL